ncbi:hypothetical protein ABZP36_015295 [Zizania latifolia]
MADSTATMTVDFLRARLLSERSVSRAAKERADELANRVAELEEQVREVTAQRRHAERAATEVLAILESQGLGGSLSDVLDSGSDHDGEEDEEPRDASPGADTAGSPGEEQAPTLAQGEAEDALSGTAQDGGLTWKGRSVSPRKARQLKQKHRRSYFYFLASDPSPKYRMGQSCRKNKRKELSNGRSAAAAAAEEEGGNVAELAGSQKGQQDGSDCTDYGQADLYGEVAGDDRSSGDCGGQYVIRYVKDGEMERVLERQAELIGQYEAEEEAQRQWEKRFNENRSSTKVENGQGAQCIEELKSSVRNLSSTRNNRSAAGRLFDSSLPESPQNASRQHVAADKRNAHEEHRGNCPSQSQESSSGVGAMARQNRDHGDKNPDMKAPSDRSPSTSDATLNSKVSDWSLSRFHNHGDNNQFGTSPDQQAGNNMDVESVLQALQLARISLRQKLNKPVPPSQVTLALPAPGDDLHTEENGYSAVDDEFNSARDEPCSSSPSRQEIMALPAPEDYHEREDLPGNDANISLTEELVSSSPQRQEILALPAPGDDFYSMTENDIKMPIGAAGLFRLPTDSFPKDEMLSRCSSTYGFSVQGLRPRATTLQNDFASNTAARVTVAPSMLRDDPSFSAKQCYDPHSSMLFSVPATGRCSGTRSSDCIGGASFLSGIPGLAEDFMKRMPLADADLFMQRGCDYTISNKPML